MKIDVVKSIIALGVSALIAYGFFAFVESDNRLLLVIVCFAELFLSSLLILGIRLELPRTTILVRTVSSIFFFTYLVSNIIYAIIDFSKPVFIIVNGLLFLIHTIIVYSVVKARQ